jgi:hypothetical protein
MQPMERKGANFCEKAIGTDGRDLADIQKIQYKTGAVFNLSDSTFITEKHKCFLFTDGEI